MKIAVSIIKQVSMTLSIIMIAMLIMKSLPEYNVYIGRALIVMIIIFFISATLEKRFNRSDYL